MEFRNSCELKAAVTTSGCKNTKEKDEKTLLPRIAFVKKLFEKDK